MKKALIIGLLTALSLASLAQNPLKAANDLYIANKFEAAQTAYLAILEQGLESHALYYNLGNCYYKQNKYSLAVLQYERALLLGANHKKTIDNLSLARTYVGDAIEPLPELFISKWLRQLHLSMSANSWAILTMVAFLLFFVALGTYLFSRKVFVRKISFLTSALILFVSIWLGFLANKQHQFASNHQYAIVLTESQQAMSAPNDSGNEVFIIHEGTKVKIISQIDNWLEIRLADGNLGWIPQKSLERI